MKVEAKDLEKFEVHMEFRLSSQVTSYSSKEYVNVSINEQLPVNVDPQRYMSQRLAEELRRAFSQVREPVNNFTDEFLENNNPLEVK